MTLIVYRHDPASIACAAEMPSVLLPLIWHANSLALLPTILQDGGYHVQFAHKALAQQLDLSHYTSTLYDVLSIQTCTPAENGRTGSEVASDTAQARLAGRAPAYAFVYPNCMINRYGSVCLRCAAAVLAANTAAAQLAGPFLKLRLLQRACRQFS